MAVMTITLHPTVEKVTARIVGRSEESRSSYLAQLSETASSQFGRSKLSCANWAHAFAAEPAAVKVRARDSKTPNIGIVSAYNDMLSAHQPMESYPALIKQAAFEAGATAQYAGGVPAMCDGVTQGRPGMELSLFSRDVIAMSTAVALTHDAFDGALLLGVCDKIVPGLVIGALAFGHLPAIFVPAGPMSSGLPNNEKAKVRGLYAEGKVGRAELLAAEQAAYHGPGTCTFYGTANSNQMLMEIMGLHIPGSAFIHPGTALRHALVKHAAKRVAAIGLGGDEYTPIGRVVSEKAVVNGIVGLMATGGSTNHALHLVAMARAAGVKVTLEDLDELSRATPQLARVYPNGSADVNQFHAAGGMAFVIRELLKAGLAHSDVVTVAGADLHAYTHEPTLLGDGSVEWRDGADESLDETILRPADAPFSREGGLRLLTGGLGRAVIKVSAVKPEHLSLTAPAAVFQTQEEFVLAFTRGDLNRDVVVVVRFQGPSANGMPELHGLSPSLGVLLDRGFRVALVTDGRMSGASGKTPAAIHVTPEAAKGGPLAYVQDGDLIRLDADAGILEVLVDPTVLSARKPAPTPSSQTGFGRELFAGFRAVAGPADHGASALFG